MDLLVPATTQNADTQQHVLRGKWATYCLPLQFNVHSYNLIPIFFRYIRWLLVQSLPHITSRHSFVQKIERAPF